MNFVHKVEQLSIRDYLEGELLSPIKHEYINGKVYAMAGASSNHNRIVTNLVSEFRTALKNTASEPFGSDMKVQVEDDFFYPDVLVVCRHEANNNVCASKFGFSNLLSLTLSSRRGNKGAEF